MPACHILVVRLGAMGDVLHALPAVASLKQSFPHSHVTWVIEQKWSALLEGNAFVDRVLSVDRGSLSSLLQVRKQLRERRFDFAVEFQGLFKSALVTALARTNSIYGFDRSQVRERIAALFYSHTIKAKAAHVVDRNLELAQMAGATNVIRTFQIPPGLPEGVLPEGDFVLANPLAGWTSKQWPLENYALLGARLKRELKLSLVLNVPAWHPLDIPDTLVNISELPGLIYATRRAAAVVGLDSGPMHLAAALRKPGVALFGPTDPARNGPYGGSLQVLRCPGAVTSYKRGATIDASMQAITVDAVFESLKSSICCTAN
ncbi:MAG TPA: glycosyltransferase family 9 protein [Bryobacteraceae bacterium]|nr:glycosyltransferase family 9 protein [Bryobacteraceae bacterium]